MMPQPVELYLKVYGQGEPLIILHGLLGSSSNWSKISQLLGKRLQVFAVDLRNHGNLLTPVTLATRSLAMNILAG